MKQWSRSLLILFVLALSVAAKSAKIPTDLKTAPPFDLPTRSGNISLDSLRGKIVLIDFWASWCAPCRQSFPWMSKVYNRYKSKGFEIVAINLDKKKDLADDFIFEFSPPFTVAFDPEGKTAEAYGVPAMPSSYIVNQDGTIIHFHAGFDPKKTDIVEKEIQEAFSR